MTIIFEYLEIIGWCALALSMGAVPIWLLHKFNQWREWMAIDPEERAKLEELQRADKRAERQARLHRREVER